MTFLSLWYFFYPATSDISPKKHSYHIGSQHAWFTWPTLVSSPCSVKWLCSLLALSQHEEARYRLIPLCISRDWLKCLACSSYSIQVEKMSKWIHEKTRDFTIQPVIQLLAFGPYFWGFYLCFFVFVQALWLFWNIPIQEKWKNHPFMNPSGFTQQCRQEEQKTTSCPLPLL